MRCPECDTRWNNEVVVVKELKNLCPHCGHAGIATNMTHALNDKYDYTDYSKLFTKQRRKKPLKSKLTKCGCA